MTRSRAAAGAIGVLVLAYGAWLLVSERDLADLVDSAVWLGAGVVVHDLVLAPLALGAGVLLTRVLPPAARGPAVVGAVVLGTVTLAAVPVLGRFGAVSENPTLLDRDYTTGWLVLAGLVLAGVALGAWWNWWNARRHAGRHPRRRTPVR